MRSDFLSPRFYDLFFSDSTCFHAHHAIRTLLTIRFGFRFVCPVLLLLYHSACIPHTIEITSNASTYMDRRHHRRRISARPTFLSTIVVSLHDPHTETRDGTLTQSRIAPELAKFMHAVYHNIHPFFSQPDMFHVQNSHRQ